MNSPNILQNKNMRYSPPIFSSADDIEEVGIGEVLPRTETQGEDISKDLNYFYIFAIPALAIIMSSDCLIDSEKRYMEPEVRTAYQICGLNISNLNWSKEEILDTHNRLQHFQEDWDAPGMELYDYM